LMRPTRAQGAAMNTGSTNDTHAHHTSRAARVSGASRTAGSVPRRATARRSVRAVKPDTVVPRPAPERVVGRVALSASPGQPGRVFTCDPVNHQIDVSDTSLRPLFSFGGFGSGPGQFNQ